MGRDYLELLEWQQTKTPPLLGPQISILSFNQSPFYFYFLFPLYLLTGGSPFASTYTIILWYLTWFVSGIWLYRKDRTKMWQLVIIGLLFSVHAEVIRQTRFVWNPSFLPPLIIASLFVHQQLTKAWHQKTAWVLALTGSLAMSLNFSAVPIYLVLFFTLVYFRRKKIVHLMFMTLAGFGIWYAPTLVFELRHQFALTKLLFTGQTNPNALGTLTNKLVNIEQYILLTPSHSIFLASVLLCTVIGVGLVIYTKTRQASKRFELAFYSLNLLLLTALTLISPITVEAHYIFGLLSLLVFVISLLPIPLGLLATLIYMVIWIISPQFPQQFVKAPRTVADMQACYQTFCSSIRDPVYVSMESGLLPFHNAPEHRYLMIKSGCNVKDIIKTQSEAEYMAVVADSATYDHSKTAYHELTLFGPSREIDVVECSPNLKVHVLKKK
jgi:hypothetical protein